MQIAIGICDTDLVLITNSAKKTLLISLECSNKRCFTTSHRAIQYFGLLGKNREKTSKADFYMRIWRQYAWTANAAGNGSFGGILSGKRDPWCVLAAAAEAEWPSSCVATLAATQNSLQIPKAVQTRERQSDIDYAVERNYLRAWHPWHWGPRLGSFPNYPCRSWLLRIGKGCRVRSWWLH